MSRTNPRSMNFFSSFYSSASALVAEKYPVDWVFTGLKSVRYIKNMAIFIIKITIEL